MPVFRDGQVDGWSVLETAKAERWTVWSAAWRAVSGSCTSRRCAVAIPEGSEVSLAQLMRQRWPTITRQAAIPARPHRSMTLHQHPAAPTEN